ncbi:MAG: peptidoglycan-binding domain-containing protein [Pseudomonadota bacterium]
MIPRCSRYILGGLLLLSLSGCKTLVALTGAQSGKSSNEKELAKIVEELEKKTDRILAQQQVILGGANAEASSESVDEGVTVSALQSADESSTEPAAATNIATGSSVVATGSGVTTTPIIPGVSELPSNPEPGQCYAHVWRDPILQTDVTTVKVRDEEEIVNVIPAQFQTVSESVLVQDEVVRQEPVPAIFETVSEQVLVTEERRRWTIGLEADAPDASPSLIAEARTTGFDLEGAAVDGMCYHEHYYPATYQTYSEQVLVKEAVERIEIIPAKYGEIDKQILVEPERDIEIAVPAVYKSVIKTIEEEPARNEWQQCGGDPGQTVGQVMCFVEIPAKYKTITQQVIDKPATTRIETIPARYETVKVRGVIEEAREVKVTEPAQYAVVTKQRQVGDPRYAWHVIDGGIEPKRTRTGRKLCYNYTPPEYRTVAKSRLVQPASTREVRIPPKFKTVLVKKEIAPQRIERTTVPAQYQTVTSLRVVEAGRMEWRGILCEADRTPDMIQRIQSALSARGYSIQSVDGRFGQNTRSALNQFQTDQGLPKDQFINLETIRALGVPVK